MSGKSGGLQTSPPFEPQSFERTDYNGLFVGRWREALLDKHHLDAAGRRPEDVLGLSATLERKQREREL
jgi:hypothetical protein